jgi:hypothetical protein
MEQRLRCACCTQEEQPGEPLYYLRRSDRFVRVCERCVTTLAAGARDHAPESLLAA